MILFSLPSFYFILFYFRCASFERWSVPWRLGTHVPPHPTRELHQHGQLLHWHCLCEGRWGEERKEEWKRRDETLSLLHCEQHTTQYHSSSVLPVWSSYPIPAKHFSYPHSHHLNVVIPYLQHQSQLPLHFMRTYRLFACTVHCWVRLGSRREWCCISRDMTEERWRVTTSEQLWPVREEEKCVLYY